MARNICINIHSFIILSCLFLLCSIHLPIRKFWAMHPKAIMRVILSRNLCSHGGQRCPAQVHRLKAPLQLSLQLPEHASAGTLMLPSHSMGLGCQALRIVCSGTELSASILSLEEQIHLEQGHSHLLSASISYSRSEGLKILERGDKGSRKSNFLLCALKTCKVSFTDVWHLIRGAQASLRTSPR